MLSQLVLRFAQALMGTPPPRVPPGVRKAEATADRMPAFIPASNPLDDEPASGLRQQDALSLLDADCYGYLLITVHKESVGVRARIHIAEQIEPSWWPAIAVTCDEIADQARRVA